MIFAFLVMVVQYLSALFSGPSAPSWCCRPRLSAVNMHLTVPSGEVEWARMISPPLLCWAAAHLRVMAAFQPIQAMNDGECLGLPVSLLNQQDWAFFCSAQDSGSSPDLPFKGRKYYILHSKCPFPSFHHLLWPKKFRGKLVLSIQK